MLSASRMGLAAECPGSMVLPQVPTQSDAADDGHARHRFFEFAPEIGVDAALAEAPEHLRATLALLVEHPSIASLLAQPSMREVAVAWDWRDGSARLLQPEHSRDYSQCTPTEIPGTADRVALVGDDTVVIHDWKGREAQKAAAKHPQLRFLAVALATAFSRTRVVVAWVRTLDGVPQLDYATFDQLDLLDIAGEAGRVARAVEDGRIALAAGQRPRMTRGPWCARCDAFDFCPAQGELLQIAVRKPEQLANEAEVALTNGARGEAFRIWEELKLLTKRIGERITAHAAVRPIELGEGRFYGYAPGDRKAKDPAKVKAILTAHVGAEAAAAAVKEETKAHTTIGAIDKALKALPPKQRPGVWAELLAAGAVAQPPSLGEYEQAPAATEAA